ncbi:MAG: hypothetical protein CFE21_08910 [Bacteroidetes bacterium B1(2017)]|nr:MAG: hypothetical protein CFE21_08910 [Bacteroidetes bacterium B1(2017)]
MGDGKWEDLRHSQQQAKLANVTRNILDEWGFFFLSFSNLANPGLYTKGDLLISINMLILV